MLVKVYQDTKLRVVIPNPRLRGRTESELDFVNRIAALTELRDPTLQGKRSAVMDFDALPIQERDDPVNIGKRQVTRDAWKLDAQDNVVIDEAKVWTRGEP